MVRHVKASLLLLAIIVVFGGLVYVTAVTDGMALMVFALLMFLASMYALCLTFFD